MTESGSSQLSAVVRYSTQAWPVGPFAVTHRTSGLRQAWQHAKNGAERPAQSNSECLAWSQGASHDGATGRPTESIEQCNTRFHGRGLLSRLEASFYRSKSTTPVTRLVKRLV